MSSSSSDPPDDSRNDLPPPARNTQAEFQQALEDWKRSSGQHNAEQLEAVGLNLLALASEYAEQNPSPEDAWQARIDACEARADWEGSLAVRREFIAWKRDHDPHQIIWKNLLDFAELLWMCGKASEAVTVVDEAVGLAKQSGLDVAPLMTVTRAARYAAALGRLADAQRLIDEALGSTGTAACEKFDRRLTLYSRLVRARVALCRGDLLIAQAQLEEIWPEIAPYGDSMFLAGLRARHAEYADIAGGIHLARGEFSLAGESFERAHGHWLAILQMEHARHHIALHSLARAALRWAEAVEPTDPEAAALLRQQAREQFASLGLPPPTY